MDLIMNKLTIFAVVKIKESLAQPLHFAESREMADKFIFQGIG